MVNAGQRSSVLVLGGGTEPLCSAAFYDNCKCFGFNFILRIIKSDKPQIKYTQSDGSC